MLKKFAVFIPVMLLMTNVEGNDRLDVIKADIDELIRNYGSGDYLNELRGSLNSIGVYPDGTWDDWNDMNFEIDVSKQDLNELMIQSDVLENYIANLVIQRDELEDSLINYEYQINRLEDRIDTIKFMLEYHHANDDHANDDHADDEDE